VFAVNKLDAVADPALAYTNICGALNAFAAEANVQAAATVPVSALKGWNVVDAANAAWCGYSGPTLLQILEQLPVTPADHQEPFAFPVQWVEKNSSSSDTSQGRRVFWGRLATGSARVGQTVKILPSGQTANIAQVLNTVRLPQPVEAGHSAGIVLDREVDVSRGDWLLSNDSAPTQAPADDFDDTPTGPFHITRELHTTVAWMDDEPLVAGRVYLALHGHRWVKARVKRIHHRLDINTLAKLDTTELPPNAIGHVELALQEAVPVLPFGRSRVLGSMILVDTASHKTSGALLLNA
jgi:sulfate adenylyltransferase subunit 1